MGLIGRIEDQQPVRMPFRKPIMESLISHFFVETAISVSSSKDSHGRLTASRPNQADILQ